MLQKGVFLLLLSFIIVSCQFTETLVLNEDGSGKMSIHLNMDDMMAFGGMGGDTTTVKMDTLISMKQILEEKKDSIAHLSNTEQERLKKIENYTLHLVMDTEASKMQFDVSSNFKTINEANNLMNGLSEGSSFIPGVTLESENKEKSSKEIIGVLYSFKNEKFTRNAYIIDEKLHKQQIDSMKSIEAFMSDMQYTLKYTFPKKIAKSSIEDATYSFDRKSIEINRSFLDYMKDPDVLDLEIELEN